MDIKLPEVTFEDYYFLYQLLEQRPVEANISHSKMPSMEKHISFCESKPYKTWKIIFIDGKRVGAVYLTKLHEIGIQIIEKYRRRHLALGVIEIFMKLHKGPFFANIAPNNEPQAKLFEKLGFKIIQVTYKGE